ncbi:Uncharacterised protein [Haemophilus influenzae]|uniref:Lipoprotein n=1 Tax=Haemophilus influenzae TaxID=727 RepID=A0A2X1PMM2_HAEIF|nr:Uncharacterised protein [Haemophilus influenzae]
MKLIATLGMAALLSGCSMFDSQQSAIPAEFAGADYQLSDQHAKQWAIASKQVEQCVYPKFNSNFAQHFSKEDSYIPFTICLFLSVGKNYWRTICEDYPSR